MEKKRLYTIAWRQIYGKAPHAPIDPIELALKTSKFEEAKAIITQIKSKL